MSDSSAKTVHPYIPPDQQPIQRVVGKRLTPPPGALPSSDSRAAMTANAQYLTRAPKGIFFYKNHDEMTRDRVRWAVDAVLARRAERA
jgi:hypothetical protein